MNIADLFYSIFQSSISDFHLHDNVDENCINPFEEGTLNFTLYQKNWIDTIQWHLEDIIRYPEIDCLKALQIKRRIDYLNQERTNIVECIDDIFFNNYSHIKPAKNAILNTESIGWAIDRLSILALKIYHIQIELLRTEVSKEHLITCEKRKHILLSQKNDLQLAVCQLLEDIASGRKIMRVYRQLKMYNDPALNPVLYIKTTK